MDGFDIDKAHLLQEPGHGLTPHAVKRTVPDMQRIGRGPLSFFEIGREQKALHMLPMLLVDVYQKGFSAKIIKIRKGLLPPPETTTYPAVPRRTDTT